MLDKIIEYFARRENGGWFWDNGGRRFRRLSQDPHHWGPYEYLDERAAVARYVEETGEEFPRYRREAVPEGTRVWVPVYGTLTLKEDRWVSGPEKIFLDEDDEEYDEAYTSGCPQTEGERFVWGEPAVLTWDYVESHVPGALNDALGRPWFYPLSHEED